MTAAPTAYPLAWPPGWPRERNRQDPKFRTVTGPVAEKKSREITMEDARHRLSAELDKLGARYPVLSTNVELRVAGPRRANGQAPSDTGVAVYFQLKNKPIVLACDRWRTVAGNIAAIAAHIDAMRGMDRWGVGSLDQMFTGYSLLPAPIVPEDWRTPLGNPATLAEANENYRQRMKDCAGDGPRAYELNAAIERARKEFGGG